MMKRLGLLLCCALTLGCAGRMPLSKLPSALVGLAEIPRVGETVTVVSEAGDATATLVLENPRTGATRTLPLDLAAGASFTLDAATLPDFAADLRAQRFDATITSASGQTAQGFVVVSEPDVRPFPRVPLGKASRVSGEALLGPPGTYPLTDDPTEAGVKAYLDVMLAQWTVAPTAIETRAIERGGATIPTRIQAVAQDVPLVENRIVAAFPKYLVPAEYNAARTDDVYAPAELRLVLTRSDPAVLVSMTAIERMEQ